MSELRPGMVALTKDVAARILALSPGWVSSGTCPDNMLDTAVPGLACRLAELPFDGSGNPEHS